MEQISNKKKEIKLTSNFKLAVKSKPLLSNKFFFPHKYKLSISTLSLVIFTWFVAWDLMTRLPRSSANPIPFQENFV